MKDKKNLPYCTDLQGVFVSRIKQKNKMSAALVLSYKIMLSAPNNRIHMGKIGTFQSRNLANTT